MVQALALLLPGLTGSLTVLGVSLVGVTGALTIAGSLVNAALLHAVQGAFQSQQPAPTPDNIKLNIKQAVGARIKHYGRVRAGGTVVFFRAKEGKFYRVIVHGHGEISSVLTAFLDNKEVTISSNVVQDAQYDVGGVKRVSIFNRLGVIPETYYSEIEAVWPAWDVDHRLDGLWTSLTIAEQVPAEDFRSTYPNNEPSLEVEAETTKVYDPRTGLTAYSDNAALIIADFIESADGLNRPGSINTAQLIIAANDADDALPLAGGGTEPRYRLSGSYGLNERPRAVLSRMVAACAGDIKLLPDGTIGVYMGVWDAPTVTLTTADVLEVQSYGTGPDGLDRYTELPFLYVDRGLDYQQVTGDPWHDAGLVADYGAASIGPLVDMNYSPSHSQSRRAAKIKTAVDNPDNVLTIRFKTRALEAIYERVITLLVPEIGFNGTYSVTGFSFSMEDYSLTLTLSALGSAAYSWASSEEGQPQAIPTPDISAGIPDPANLAAGPSGAQTSGSTFTAGIGIQWDAPTIDSLSPSLQYSLASSTSWQTVPLDSGATSAQVTGLVDGTLYDVRLALVANDGTVGDYVGIDDVVANADTSPPAAPTSLAVVDETGGNAGVSFISSSSAGIWKTEIFRDAVLIATFYNSPSEMVNFTDASGAGTFAWTARSINVSAIANASDAGPASQTIT